MKIPKGWKLVPTELTEEMNVAGIFAASQLLASSGKEGLDAKRREIYRAQLAAAPTPPAHSNANSILVDDSGLMAGE